MDIQSTPFHRAIAHLERSGMRARACHQMLNKASKMLNKASNMLNKASILVAANCTFST